GQLGIGSTIASRVPGQIGSASKWVKVWAGGVTGAGLQSDGSLWLWGSLMQRTNELDNLLVPTRLSPDTNWVEAAFGPDDLVAVKSDGTLWAWGRFACVYGGSTE